MLRAKEQVIWDPAACELAQAAQHIVAQQPVDLRLILNQVPHALKLWITLEFVERRAHPRIGQVHPAHYASNELVFRRETEQPAGLIENGIRLHHYRSVEAVPFEDGLQVAGKKIAPERRFARRYPRIPEAADIPEVLVRVDAHSSIIK